MSEADIKADWIKSVEWLRKSSETGGTTLIRLTDALVNDDPRDLIRMMKADRDIADIVQRLALLALQESSLRIAKE